MTVSPLGPPPFPTKPSTGDRSASRAEPAPPEPSGDTVSVSGAPSGAVKEMLQAMIEEGFSVVSFNEDSARAAAEAVKAALASEGKPIANADPAGFMNSI